MSRKTKADKGLKKFNIKRVLAIVLTASVVVYFGGTFISQQRTLNKKNDEIKMLEQKIAEAATETERLKQEVENLENPEYIEKIARERLGLIGPNERVFVDANKADETP